MSPKQDALYWREWAAVRRVNPDADRHELHARALGADKSHKAFTNQEFDRVLAEFRAISEPGNLDAQLRQMQQPKTRLIYAITRLVPEAYRLAILRDKFGTEDMEELTESQLTMLRNTLAARANKLRRKVHQPTARELAVAGGVECPF